MGSMARGRWPGWAPLKTACGLCFLLLLCGCAGTRFSEWKPQRRFDFHTDSLAYANELYWEYHFDASGRWKGTRQERSPDYTLHCFVVVRAARQFFQSARFDPVQPVSDEATYRALVRRVVATNPRRVLPETEKIVIPGYANLREFSEAHERLLKAECGGAWQSYLQRGNWRMVFPFSPEHQEHAARRIAEDLRQERPVIVHLVRMRKTLNHAILLYDVQETENEIRFAAYDPNNPNEPTTLTFDRATRSFQFPANNYFPGGRVDVYEVYRNLIY